MTTLNEAPDLAAKAAMKEERARDAVRAMQEYKAERLAVLERTARLRALRLAKETGTPIPETAKSKPATSKPAKRQAKEKRR